LTAVLLVPFVLAVLWLGWRSRAWPLVHDAPIMHYAAWRIGQGAVPYRDVFDMNFPGTYLVHLAVLRTLGPGDAAWRVFDLAWLAATAFAVGAFAAPWGAAAAGGGAAFFALHHLAAGPWQAGQRDYLLCVFLLVSALGVARWLEGAGRGRTLVWSGAALGAGMTIKPHAAVFAAALAVALAVGAWRRDAGTAATLAAFGAGIALVPLAIVAWLGAAGGLAAWRAIVADYLVPLYSRLGRPGTWGFHRWHVWIAIGVAAMGSLVTALAAGRFSSRHAVAAAGLGYGVVHYVGQGKGWEYHVYPLAAFAAVLVFAEVTLLARARSAAAVPIAAALVAVVVSLTAKGAAASDAGWIRDKQARVAAVVADLRPLVRPGDTVQVLDTTEGGVHALLRLGLAEPTRFLYDFHFFHDVDRPVIRALRAELLRGLDARRPRAIVLFERGWPTGGYDRVARFPGLAERLARDYRIAVNGAGYRIYATRAGS
jgi:hypothetical protein